MFSSRDPRIQAYLIAGAGFCLDQVSKWMVEQLLRFPGASVSVIPVFDVLRFTYVTNTGAAWGVLEGFASFFILVGLIVSGCCVWVIETHANRWVRMSAALILGGGLGNTVDRLLLRSGVVDFLDMGVLTYRWPTFNVADMMLIMGIAVLVWAMMQGEVVFGG